jgi:hypothetical protein
VAEILDHVARVGLTPGAYLELMTAQAAADPDDLPDDSEREKLEFTKLNLHRTGRISRTWQPTAELKALLDRVATPQTWLVLTEPWCGDSAQCLPCLVKMAEQQPAITVQLVLRDTNLDLMDQYLTNGSRSIPRLVVFDAEGRELFQWGPRPAAAQEVFLAAKSEGLEKPDILEKLHLFYGRNRSAALDAEFVSLLAAYLDGAR